jgi:hypothetical protein
LKLGSNKNITLKEVFPLLCYTLLNISVITVPPLILYNDCKHSPNYIAHIIFAILQIMLLIGSHLYYKKKLATAEGQGEISSTMLNNQGRCCREIISHLKLLDTYTNLCFYTLIIHNISQLPLYMVIIASVSIGATIITKLGFIINLVFFTLYIFKS